MDGLSVALLIANTLLLAFICALILRGARSSRADAEREHALRRNLDALEKRLREDLYAGFSGSGQALTAQLGDNLRTQAGHFESYARQMGELNRDNEERMERMRSTLDARIREMRADNAEKLEKMRATVDEKLNATLETRLSESFRLVSDRLEQVYKGLGEMQKLAAGVGDLQRTLTNVTARGAWGEVQLGALLADMLAPGQYLTNTPVRPQAAERVEFAIRLPGRGDEGAALLPIDSKFPQESYRRLLDAQQAANAVVAEAEGKALEADIRREAKRIASKYIAPPYTTDFAILFLPVEGLYAETLRRNGLAESLQRDLRVVVAGPTTFAALLNSLQMGFRTLAIEKRTADVWELLGLIKSQFGVFTDLLEKTQKKLQGASGHLEDATKKSRAIAKKLGDVQMIETDGKPLTELSDDRSDDDNGVYGRLERIDE